MNILGYTFTGIIMVLLPIKIIGQSLDYDIRNVIVNTSDSVLKTSVWNKPLKRKANPEYNYYWYYAGAINHNLGSYSGKLLHGKCEVFDNQQKLRSQGDFEYGIKKGNWYRWYQNGNMQFYGYFKNGLLEGNAKTYTAEGNLSSLLKYNKGKLDGKSYFFLKDTTIVRKYRDGKEVIKRKKTSKKNITKKVDEKKEDDKKQIAVPVSQQKQIKTGEGIKKKWWQFSFLKRKREKGTEISPSVENNPKSIKPIPKQQLGSEVTAKKKWWQFSFLRRKKVEEKDKTMSLPANSK